MSRSLMSGCRATCYIVSPRSISITQPAPTHLCYYHQAEVTAFQSCCLSRRTLESELCSIRYPATESSADDLADAFDSVISGLFDKHAPASEFTVRERSRQPWFDNECREAGGRLDVWLGAVKPTMLVQRANSKPVAQNYVRVGNCPNAKDR